MAKTLPMPVVEAVVVGASMGGVEALTTLFSGLRKDFSAAIIVVLHLPRNRPSLLTELFERTCALQVREVNDKEPILPGTIYFAPADYHILVDRGAILSLSIDAPVHFCRPAIDVLFESAADFYRDHLLGIILTGNNEDGAAGLASVRHAGGRAVVQDLLTARGWTMPAAALARVPDAEVKSLAQIAELLQDINRSNPMETPHDET